MAKFFDGIDDAHRKFIEAQHIFFVGTAARDGRVNVSPKGTEDVHIDGPNRIIWANLTGSGNETAGHLQDVNRMTLMWCSFETRPLILRCYGTARTIHARDPEWDGLRGHFSDNPGLRQIYDMHVEQVQTSCGYAVPFMDYREDRQVLRKWAEDKGEDGVRAYWAERNSRTIDGLPTGVVDDA